MIRPTRVQSSRVFALAMTQLATLKASPDLEKGLLVSGSEIEAMLVEVRALVDAHLHMVKATKAAKDGIQRKMFEFSELLKGNIDQAVDRYGSSSSEPVMLGGKRRNVERRTKPAAPAVGTDK